MKVLILDNRDSFVFNLQHRFYEIGVESVVVRSDTVSVAEIAAAGADAICISPGPGHPSDAGVSVAAVRQLSGSLPILGVCLGHQAIGVAFGGIVSMDGQPVHGRSSTVHHDEDELFASIPRDFEAGRYHSLAIEAPLPAELRSIAHGDGLVMAVAHVEHRTFGVQFHPESILSPHGLQLLENFAAIAAR